MTPPEPPFPEGATKIKPRLVKTGSWVEMEVDAELEFAGLTWLRAKGGFGSGQRDGWHPREDWIADIPQMSLHVGRYWNEPDNWKHEVSETMEEAMASAVRRGCDDAHHRVRKAEREVADLHRALELLSEAERRIAA